MSANSSRVSRPLRIALAASALLATACAKPNFAALATAQGRPGGAWASPACGLEDVTLCRVRCAQKKWDACNNLGVIREIGPDADAADTAAGLYRTACTFGSEGACYNLERLTHTKPELAGAKSAADADDLGVRGALTMNDAPFAPTGCHSGQPSGFIGVDIDGASGARLRVVSGVDGKAVVIVFAPGYSDAAAKPMSGCVTTRLHATELVREGVRVLDGSARFDCRAPVKLSGEVTFRCGP